MPERDGRHITVNQVFDKRCDLPHEWRFGCHTVT